MGRKRGRKRQNGRPNSGQVQYNVLRDNIRVKGHEVFAALATSSSSGGAFSGTGSYNLTLPNLADRLALLGRVYDRYKIKSLLIEYVPLSGTTIFGSLAIGITDDIVTSDTTTSTASFLTVNSMRNSFATQVYEKASLTYRPVDPKKWYYTDPAASGSGVLTRFVCQTSIFGQFSSANISSNQTLGYLRINYDVEFAGAVTPTTLSPLKATRPRVEFVTRGEDCTPRSTISNQSPSVPGNY